MDRCAYCGEELNPNAHFCPNCGRPRAEAPQPEAAPEAPLAEAEYEIEEAEYVIEEAEDATAQPSERVDHVIVDRKQAPRPARETAPGEEPAAPAEGYASRPEGYAARPEGYASRPEGDYAPQPAPKASGLSIAAFVCSLSLILCGLGAILAVVDLVKGKSQPRKKGLSVAALVISGVVLVMSFIGNTFLKAGLLAPKGETLNEIAAAAATKAPGTGAKATANPTAKATRKPASFPRPTMPPAIDGQLLFSPADEFDFVAAMDKDLRWEYKVDGDGFMFTRELETDPTARVGLTSQATEGLPAGTRMPDGMIAELMKDIDASRTFTPRALQVHGGYTGSYLEYTVPGSGESLKLASWLAGDRIYVLVLMQQDAKTDAEALFNGILNTFQLAPAFDTATPAQQQAAALEVAQRYKGYGYSYRYLINLLMESHGIAPADAIYAADHCGLDWNAEAAARAKDDGSSWLSFTGAIDKLQTLWLFPEDQARYGANQVDAAEWKVHALNLCQMLFESEYGGWSYSSVLSALERDGFTTAQIMYAKEHWTVDFKEQALKEAQYTLKANGDSSWIRQRDNMVGHLESHGFTNEEATYAADKLGIR